MVFLKGVFSSSRGLRQGDLLSLFLFTLLADSFSALMSRVISCGLVEGVPMVRSRSYLSHFQFADDTICFLKAEVE